MKKCSTLIIIREMQIRTRMAIIKILKSLQIINAGEGVEKRELFNTVVGNVNRCIPNREQNGGFFLIKLKIELSYVCSLSCVWLLQSMAVAHQVPLSMVLSRQGHCNGLPFLLQVSSQPTSPTSLHWLEDSLPWTTWEVHVSYHISCNPTPGIYLEQTIIWIDTCTPMFIAALFTTAKTRNEPKCSSTDEWVKKIHIQWKITQP